MALLQKRMSRCLHIIQAPPSGALRVSGHATPDTEYSTARLVYMSSADQYLSYAVRILSGPTNPSTTLEQILVADTRAFTLTVLGDLHEVIFGGNRHSAGRGRDDLRHGCRDYHILINNFMDTVNAHHQVLYPLLLESHWTDDFHFSNRLDDLRRCLDKHILGKAKHAVVIGAHLRYSTGDPLEVAIKRCRTRCLYVHR